MRREKLGKLVICVFVALPLLHGSLLARDKKTAGKALDPAAVDESVYQNLRDIIDRGANLYNRGDWNGCYRLWEGSLLTLKPFLDHRPKLQEAINDGIASARRDPALWHRAWVLRPVLDKIRADINADHPHGKKRDGDSSKVAVPKRGKSTLWDRLGGEQGVTKLVDDFVNLAAPDRKVDFFRGGKRKMTAEQVSKMKRELVEQISQASGGPLKYTGPDMKAVHKGMGITEAQFNAAAGLLKKALEKNNVAADDVEKVLDAVGSYRKEIVQPKKKDDSKPAEKKEEKKPANAASIQGVVTLKGKPLTGGAIVFTNARGKAGGGITPQGTYKVEGIKPGEYTVSITGGKGDAVPAKYGDPKTSALKTIVRDGKQSFDIAFP